MSYFLLLCICCVHHPTQWKFDHIPRMKLAMMIIHCIYDGNHDTLLIGATLSFALMLALENINTFYYLDTIFVNDVIKDLCSGWFSLKPMFSIMIPFSIRPTCNCKTIMLQMLAIIVRDDMEELERFEKR